MGLFLSLIQIALTVYAFIILARFVLSWVPLRSRTPAYRFYSLLHDATEPYLRLFRPFVPLVRAGDAALDLSAAVGLAVLIVASMILGAL